MKRELVVEFVAGNKILESDVVQIDCLGLVGDYRLSDIIHFECDEYCCYVEYIRLNKCVENEDGTLTLKIEVTRENEFLVELIEEELDGRFGNQENMEQAAEDLLEKQEISETEYDSVMYYINYTIFVA